jgi:hypothetical protein
MVGGTSPGPAPSGDDPPARRQAASSDPNPAAREGPSRDRCSNSCFMTVRPATGVEPNG